MTQKIKWGILGAANINLDVIPAILRSPRSEVIAIASRTKEKAEKQAQVFNISETYEGYDKLLMDQRIDAVYIPLVNHLHAEWTIKALDAGKHVLCEKPLTLTIDEVKSVTEAVQRSGKVVMEAFAYLHQPQTQKVREIIKSGIIGDVRTIKGSFTFMFDNMTDFRWTPEYGGGALWDIGSYPVTYAYWLLGLPSLVYGQAQMTEGGVDISFAGQMHFPSGAVSQIDCSFDQEFFLDIDIRGTLGRVVVELDGDPKSDQVINLYKDGILETIIIDGENQYSCEITNMESAILDNATPLISLEDSLNFVRILKALYQSAKENRPIDIE